MIFRISLAEDGAFLVCVAERAPHRHGEPAGDILAAAASGTDPKLSGTDTRFSSTFQFCLRLKHEIVGSITTTVLVPLTRAPLKVASGLGKILLKCKSQIQIIVGCICCIF